MTLSLSEVLSSVSRRAREADVFGRVAPEGERLVCEAKASAEPAFYRVSRDSAGLWVELVTADRWLSESIESQLMHSGDDLEELLEEELADVGYDGPTPAVEHFRSEDRLFTFRSRVPDGGDQAEAAALILLAYEQCFRNLGDMEAGEDE